MNIEKRLFNFAVWLIAASLLAAFMTSCSATVPIPTTPTTRPTAAPTVTETAPSLVGKFAPGPTPRPSCTVTAYTLNLRAGAGMSHPVKQILTQGEAVFVIERGTWLKVSTRKTTGFIYARYCR